MDEPARVHALDVLVIPERQDRQCIEACPKRKQGKESIPHDGHGIMLPEGTILLLKAQDVVLSALCHANECFAQLLVQRL